MKIKLFVETRNAVSGSKRHDAIYPMFSSYANSQRWEYKDSENGQVVLYRKITIEDGTFTQVSRSAGYTGQHTDLHVSLDQNGINENAPQFVQGSLYSRNKYGSTIREFRLDLVRQILQIQRRGKWCDFEPANYVD